MATLVELTHRQITKAESREQCPQCGTYCYPIKGLETYYCDDERNHEGLIFGKADQDA